MEYIWLCLSLPNASEIGGTDLTEINVCTFLLRGHEVWCCARGWRHVQLGVAVPTFCDGQREKDKHTNDFNSTREHKHEWDRYSGV